MRALADLAVDDFLECVDALGRVLRVGHEHEMHAGNVRIACEQGENVRTLRYWRVRTAGGCVRVGRGRGRGREVVKLNRKDSSRADFSADHRALDPCALGME